MAWNYPAASNTAADTMQGELFSTIAKPFLLAKFHCYLDVRVLISSMNHWSNQNQRRFYIITVHWVDSLYCQIRSLILTKTLAILQAPWCSHSSLSMMPSAPFSTWSALASKVTLVQITPLATWLLRYRHSKDTKFYDSCIVCAS